MKRKSLLIMLLVALFVPLAMNAQTRSLHSPKLDKLKMNSAVARENAQNEMFVKSPVQIPNLESRNFSLGNANNAMGNSVTRDGVTYELVTTSQSDWSGTYVMAVPLAETFGYAFDGTIDDNTGGITEVTLENTTMTSIGDAAVLTIAPSTDYPSYYTIKINGGDYLADGTSGLETSSTETDYTNWDISLTSDGMQLYNPVWDGGPYYLYFLLFTNTSTQQYGAFWLTDDGSTYYDGVVEGYTFEYIFPYLFKEVSSGGSGSADCDYEKVTASQSDWSGDYVITYVNGTTAYVLSGSAGSGTQTYGSYITATVTDNILANADVADYNVTIEAVTYNNQTKYTVKLGNNYLGYTRTNTSSNNYLNFATSIPTTNPQQYYWTIAYSGSTLTMTNVYNTRRVLKYNSGSPRFACYTSGQQNITLFKKLTDCAPACPAPTNLTYSNVTGEGATLAWDGEANSYTIQIGPAPKTYGFEDGTLQGWTAYDADGDGYSWNADNSTSSSGATYYHSGTYYAMASYNESAAVDNWLISPQIQLGGSISFWVRRLSTSWTDSYRVYVSTTNTDISSFREISSGTITPGTSYTQASYPLSSYSGMGYVAIRHTAAADQAYVFVDDITIVEGGQTISNATSPYTVTGLNPATEYVWQVKADCGDGNVSPWSTSSTFTTLDLCAAPTGLSSADITNNSAALSWTGLADAYDIQYREYDATAPATLILNVPTDIWGDGTGYQLVLDADHNTYGSTIPTSASFTAGSFAEFEYTIPENAECSLTTNTIVVNGSASITIPAGVYDYALLNPDGSSTYWIASSNGNFPGRGDDYEFEAGKTYELRVYQSGTNDAVDLTISADWTSVSGTVTSPYTLTGLDPETTYEWQVKGDGCDDWSAIASFTTLEEPSMPVEFTVNAPANAYVGQTITVEAVLTAPENYSGFTDLLMAINYDHTAFQFVAGSIVYGPVIAQAQQYNAQVTNITNVTDKIQVAINCFDEGYFVTEDGIVFSAQFTVLAGAEGSYTFTAEPNGALNFDHEGVAIPYEATPSTVVVAIEQYFKPIAGWSNAEPGASNFYLIASPIGDIAPTAVTIQGDATANMVSSIGSYDLYYFDHNRDLEWVNYIDANNNPGAFSLLESGKGYLYANQNDVTLVFTGTGITSGEQTIPLDYYEEGDGFTIDLPGWNLLGNPFAETAYLTTSNSGITTSFYTMDAYGVYLPVTNGSIDPMEGVFVHAEGEGQSVTFTTTAPSKSSVLNLNLSNGRRVVDRAIVRFDRGNQLPKLQFRQGSTKVYIPVEGQDYAVVNCEEMGELPVSFKAEENGSYNLSLSSEEVSFAYLHLIDNMTGADVDLLQTPSYSFEAKTTDYESRFKLVFATGDNSNSDNFAFFSNGSFVINNDGEATLQVIDVTGRILKSESINGCTNVNVNAASGVYMLRLINGDNVKVQKVVVK